MQKILKWLPPLIAGGVSIFLVSFLVSINSNEQEIKISPLEPKNEIITQKQENSWLDTFSKTQNNGYLYPVNEVLIRVDLNENIIAKIAYKLSASLLDPYQLFCLEEEVKQRKLKYFFKKEKDSIELLIYSDDKDKLNSLVQVLKNYEINAQIEPYKEDT